MENGTVFRCASNIRARLYSTNIFTDPIKKLDRWVLCTRNLCNCEESYPKLSIKKYLDLKKDG
jgi:hypothetical protein